MRVLLILKAALDGALAYEEGGEQGLACESNSRATPAQGADKKPNWCRSVSALILNFRPRFKPSKDGYDRSRQSDPADRHDLVPRLT